MNAITLSSQSDAGSLHIVVTHDGERADRQVYQYNVSDGTRSYVDNDLQSGMFAPVDARAMLATLVSFLLAAAEAYDWELIRRMPHTSDNADMFPAWLMEQAYLNSDELTTLQMELSPQDYA